MLGKPGMGGFLKAMEKLDSAKQRIIVALDVDTREEALKLVDGLREHVGMFKVGLELLSSEGTGIVREIINRGGKVFLDGKFKDIPNTVAGASRAVTRLGITMFNVHTMGGLEMMQAAAKAAHDESSKLRITRPLVLGVTILTSIDNAILNQQLHIPGSLETQVVHLASLAEKAGLDGIIASPLEVKAISDTVSSHLIIVTPGVRPTWASAGDQKRITTPKEAIISGATYLVIGRPIIKPPAEIGTSVDAAEKIEEEIASALEKRRN